MKTSKFSLPLLVVAIITSLVSCQEDEQDVLDQTTDAKVATDAYEVASALIALGNSPATDVATQAYSIGFDKLSFEELNAFFQINYEQSMSDPTVKNDPEEQATVEKWYAENVERNQLSMRLFNRPVNQLNEEEFTKLDEKQKEGITNGKVALDEPSRCPTVNFPSSARYTAVRRDGFRATDSRFVSNDGDPTECDCQVGFPTTNGNYRYASARTARMRSLLTSRFSGFNGGVARRVVGGASAGTYLLFGSTRSSIYYTRCSEIAREVNLSRRFRN